jgi:hypothetical protein
MCQCSSGVAKHSSVSAPRSLSAGSVHSQHNQGSSAASSLHAVGADPLGNEGAVGNAPGIAAAVSSAGRKSGGYNVS